MRSFARQHLSRAVFLVAASVLVVAVPSALGAHATEGTDVKVTLDNNNVDGGRRTRRSTRRTASRTKRPRRSARRIRTSWRPARTTTGW